VGIVQVVECLRVHKAPSSIPSSAPKKEERSQHEYMTIS
jgi:hypothetical protein